MCLKLLYIYNSIIWRFKKESKNIKSPFDDSKFRCKKCGKIFCSCGGFFNRKGEEV